MLLIDIGNTTVGICQKKDDLKILKRIRTKALKNKEITLSLELDEFHLANDRALISSVVPSLNQLFIDYFNEHQIVVEFVSLENNHEFNIHLDHPEELGSDLLMVSYGALNYFNEAIIVDLGTVSKFIVYQGHDFLGGSIAIGFENSFNAIFDSAEMLESVNLVKPAMVIETATNRCIASGIINGMVALVDGMIAKIKEERKIENVILTGGAALLLKDYFTTPLLYVPDLIFEGMLKYDEAQR